MDPQARAKRLVKYNLIGLGAVLLIAMIAILASSLLSKNPSVVENTPVPLAQGKQVYAVSTGGTGPKITQVVIDPFDPQPGDNQTFSVSGHHSQPLTAVNVILMTDTASSTHQLAFIKKEGAGEVWEGTWTTTDTHLSNYVAAVHAVSGTASTTVDLTLR